MSIGQSQNEKLVQLVAKLKNAADANISSVILYGSSADGDFQADFSDLNVLLVLQSADAPTLKSLQPVIRWWREKGEPAPVILGREELHQAADVFAIELIDMKERHRVLDGDDLLSVIDIPRDLHRVQVERELRTALIRLRQRYAESKDDQSVSRLMTDSISTFATLFRHALLIFGQSAPMQKRATLDAMAQFLAADLSAMQHVLDIREKRAPQASCHELFSGYLAAVTRVTDEVDRRLG